MASPWFRSIDTREVDGESEPRDVSGEVEQGDVISNFVHAVTNPLGPWPSSPTDFENFQMKLEADLGIVLTQSCDMAKGQKMSVSKTVVVCRVYDLAALQQREDGEPFKIPEFLESIRRGDNRMYHMLRGGFEFLSSDYYLVSLREITVVPLTVVEGIVSDSSRVLRLQSPMREALAQAFSRRFDRVAIDREYEIPAFPKGSPFEKATGAFHNLGPNSKTALIARNLEHGVYARTKREGDSFTALMDSVGGAINLHKLDDPQN